jgi:alpha-glucosidase (family GH31 glycosyl hydrolase)
MATLVAACLPLTASPSEAAEVAADAGALRAEVDTDQWRMILTDADGYAVLAEDPHVDPGAAGTLGFRTAAGWAHATQITSSRREGDAYVAEMETTDASRSMEVRIAPAGDGEIAFEARIVGPTADVEAVGIGFGANDGERFLGFGERSNSVAQEGVVENYVADGPYQMNEYGIINLFVPPWGVRERDDSTYFPIPWLLSSTGFGVLVDGPETSYFRVRADSGDIWSAEVVAAPEGETGAAGATPPDRIALRFFAGPKPADVVGRMSRSVGRQPMPQAPWVYGPWYQPDDDERAELAELKGMDVPVSVLQTFTHYLPCGDQQTDRERERTAAAHADGVAITTYFNPMVCQNYGAAYDPAAAEGALTRDRLGQPYVYRYGADPTDLFVVSQFDFFTDAGAQEYARLLDEAIADGYDGWMEDFGEYTPLDSVSGNGIEGTRAHNPYPARYHCAAYDAVADAPRPIIRYQRSGWTGAAPCAQVVWGGDPTTTFGFDGLRSALTQALTLGLSGVSVWGSDIGGFFALGDNALTPEMLMRWVQLGAVSGVMRNEANGVAVPSKARPQPMDPDQVANWRRYSKLRTQLYPYLVAAQRAYRKTGMPLMRHPILAWPYDPKAASADDEFMFGPDLLAAPVVEEGQTKRQLYLPKGRWVDLWRSAKFADGPGALRLRDAKVLKGSRDATVPAPLDELPLLARAGTVLPLLPPDVDSLSQYRAKGVVNLADRDDRLALLAFPRGVSEARFGESGKIDSIEASTRCGCRLPAKKRKWRLELHKAEGGRIDLQASLGALKGGFEPCRLKVDGERLPGKRWDFHRKRDVLTARFDGRSPTMVASAKGC